MSSEDILKIVNLKHSWEFILNKNVILTQTNYSILCTINKLVEEGFYYNAGSLRNVPVKIGGRSWKHDIPIESDIKDEYKKLLIEFYESNDNKEIFNFIKENCYLSI